MLNAFGEWISASEQPPPFWHNRGRRISRERPIVVITTLAVRLVTHQTDLECHVAIRQHPLVAHRFEDRRARRTRQTIGIDRVRIFQNLPIVIAHARSCVMIGMTVLTHGLAGPRGPSGKSCQSNAMAPVVGRIDG